VILIVFFIPQGATTIANMLLPNSILPALTAMVGFLACPKAKLIHLIDDLAITHGAQRL
jgi:hypothetical protein